MPDHALTHAAELQVARRAAAEAAALIVAREGAAEVREKERADLVTAVDEAAERAVIARIRAHYPDDGVVAEETAAGPLTRGRRWIVDPIDGTTNFVHGHPFTCVSVAFADDAGLAVGVIHAPLLGEVFHAVRGGGAFLNERPIRVSDTAEPVRALLATGFPFKGGKGKLEPYFRLVADVMAETRDVRRAGSAAMDLAYVAAGRLDAYYEIGLAPWDVAAGALLVAEAGGRVGGWPGDERGPVESGRVLASNGRLHAWLEGAAARHVDRL
ncbi:MAG TPA: inositol monophosphatase family protein [Longimicrobiaceae bacterium]|nr:inositol monophosphatase family protein [Longimicrobiaceae bacterium]